LVRDVQVTNRPVYVAIGVNGERAKFWLSVLTEVKNRGVEDVCITVCEGLKGLPEAITTVWELAVVQTCVVT
jgi:transposase-like protein